MAKSSLIGFKLSIQSSIKLLMNHAAQQHFCPHAAAQANPAMQIF
jgi:hypothetical protein